MNRAEYIGKLIETLPNLTDNQVKYLCHLVKALFGGEEEEVE